MSKYEEEIEEEKQAVHPWKKPRAKRQEEKHQRAGITTNKIAQAKARKRRKKRTRR